MSDSQEYSSTGDSEEEGTSSETHPSTMEIALSKEVDASEEPAVPVYDERLHFRYFFTYSRRAWLILLIMAVVAVIWQYASSFAASVNESQITPTVDPAVEPTDEISRTLMDAINVIITAVFDVIASVFEALAGALSIPVGSIGSGAVTIALAVVAVLMFRSWMAWTHSRLTVNESGVRLVEADIPWLFIPGRVQNLHPSVVNDLAKSRDLLDQLIFWNCWQASILSFEQTGTHDEIQNVPVRGVDRLQRSVRALATYHAELRSSEERTTNQLLAEAVEELRRLRSPQGSRDEEGV